MKSIAAKPPGAILACLLALSAALSGPAYANTSSQGHPRLTGTKGLLNYNITTGWFGLSKYGFALQFNMGLGFGATLAQVDLDGSANVDLAQNTLWFTGTTSTAEMNLGIEKWAKYRVTGFGINREGDLTLLGGSTDWRFYNRQSVSGNPYFLYAPLILSDGLVLEDVIGESVHIGSLEFRASLDLESTANNSIRGRYLSTNKGVYYSTGTGEKKPVSLTYPVFTVGSIVQSSTSAWNVSVTPTAVFAVTYSWWLDYSYNLPIYTFPFNLGSFTFDTSATSVGVCTGKYYPDSDNDGWAIIGGLLRIACSKPAYYAASTGDCNDANNAVYPGATEIANGIDDDCDGNIDEGFKVFYRDADGDGYGDANHTASAPPDQPPAGYIAGAGDCNDANAAINPGVSEVCMNAVDDDCNGEIDEVCHPPIAQDQTVMALEDVEDSIVLQASDADGDDLAYSVVTGPSHGTVSVSAQSVVYLSRANYHGPDSFTFKASDGIYDSNIATVSIEVAPVNDDPVANAGADQTLVVGPACEAQAALNGSLSSDVDGDSLTYMWTWNGSAASGPNPQVTVHAGTTLITLQVNDGQVVSPRDTVLVTALDQLPPLITPTTVTTECVSPDGQDVAIVAPTVSDNCCDPTTIEVAYRAPSKYFLGHNQVLWTAVDCHNNAADAIQHVIVQDTLKPDMVVSASPGVLWPPNHKMVEVVPSIQTSDLCCGANVAVKLDSVTMNEGDRQYTFDSVYDVDPAAGYIGEDVQMIDGRIFLRAERSGNSTGRVYTLTFSATDCAGNITKAITTVVVPHDER